jgi:hypothetical protein
MTMHPVREPGETMPSDAMPSETMINAGERTTVLRQITAEQLLHLGARQVVYLKVGLHDGELAFMLYSADGTPLAMVDTVEKAVETAAEHGLSFVAVH